MSSRVLSSTQAIPKQWPSYNRSIIRSIASPRHAPLSTSTSVHLGGFVNALRRANPTHCKLAGALSSPVLQSCRSIHSKAGKSKTTTRIPRKPQPISLSKFDKPESSNASDSSARQRPRHPLIPPDRVKGYPTPVLTQEGIDKYLVPLYARCWSVEYRRAKDESGVRYAVPSLQLYFDNLTWDAFFALGRFVRQVQKSENHHGEWKVRDFGNTLEFKTLRLLGFEFPELVAFLIRTHSAALPPSTDRPRWPMKGVIEGITLRDVRFAILLDDLIEKHNCSAALTNTDLLIRKNPRNMNGVRPTTLDSLLMNPYAEKEKQAQKNRKRKRGIRPLVEGEFYFADPGFEEIEKIVPGMPGPM